MFEQIGKGASGLILKLKVRRAMRGPEPLKGKGGKVTPGRKGKGDG